MTKIFQNPTLSLARLMSRSGKQWDFFFLSEKYIYKHFYFALLNQDIGVFIFPCEKTKNPLENQLSKGF